jgi:hypothetical protein
MKYVRLDEVLVVLHKATHDALECEAAAGLDNGVSDALHWVESEIHQLLTR